MTNEVVEPSVELIAWTAFQVPSDSTWQPEHEGNDHGRQWAGQDLIEFAGRACYESWDRPNAKTASNTGYLGNIIKLQHFSVLEHASVTFYFKGLSRSLTHELVRHRHFSFSQLSQRYVDSKDAGIVIPPEIAGEDSDLEALVIANFKAAVGDYETIAEILAGKLEKAGVKGTEARKRARQAARCVLPNDTETRIVVTANHRTWREFIEKRANPAADTEIRRLACMVFDILSDVLPSVYQDFEFVNLADGTAAVEHV